MLSFLWLIIVVSVAFFSAAAKPQRTTLSQPREPVNCTNTSNSASYNSSCWNELNIPSYLTQWQATIPTCNASSPGEDGCCLGNEAWSNCFLRLTTGVTGGDCTKIGTPSCEYDSQISLNVSNSETAPQARYVVRNILAINDFFSAYFGGQAEGAIQAAAPAAGATIGEIADSLDYDGNTVLNVTNVRNALSLGLPFFGTPSLQNESFPAAAPLLQLGQLFLQSLRESPNISSAIWPTIASPYALYSLRFNAQQLPTSSTLNSILSNLNHGLFKVMSSIPAFLNFSSNGTWVGPQLIPPTLLTNSTPSIDLALLTYATSSTLAQQNFSITLPATSCIVDFVPLDDFQCETHPHHPSGTDILQTASGVTIYWSPNTQRQYKFSHNGVGGPKNGSRVDPYGVLKLIEGNGWADLPVLFDGAYNCTLNGLAGTGGSVVNIGVEGTLDMSCLSALPVYIAQGGSCPDGAVKLNGRCPFHVSTSV